MEPDHTEIHLKQLKKRRTASGSIRARSLGRRAIGAVAAPVPLLPTLVAGAGAPLLLRRSRSLAAAWLAGAVAAPVARLAALEAVATAAAAASGRRPAGSGGGGRRKASSVSVAAVISQRDGTRHLRPQDHNDAATRAHYDAGLQQRDSSSAAIETYTAAHATHANAAAVEDTGEHAITYCTCRRAEWSKPSRWPSWLSTSGTRCDSARFCSTIDDTCEATRVAAQGQASI